jgi:hypothetical protein
MSHARVWHGALARDVDRDARAGTNGSAQLADHLPRTCKRHLKGGRRITTWPPAAHSFAVLSHHPPQVLQLDSNWTVCGMEEETARAVCAGCWPNHRTACCKTTSWGMTGPRETLHGTAPPQGGIARQIGSGTRAKLPQVSSESPARVQAGFKC